jgi:glycerol-3-phosphate dehydrogenase
MAEDCVNAAVKQGKLRASECVTKNTQLLGAANWSPNHFIKLIQDFGTLVEHSTCSMIAMCQCFDFLI